MRRVLQPFRVVLVLLCMTTFILHMSVVWLVVRERWRRVRWSNRILSYYSRFGLWVLNVRARAVGLENIAGVENALFVGNHVSYMDVLVISSLKPSGFVTSVEIRDTIGLGLLCKMAGCLFVERRSRGNLMKEVGELGEGLGNGVNVAIFPEATSTNGEQIFRFRRPLFMSAIQASVPVVPFCMNYHTIRQAPINKTTRDWIFYYGEMTFMPHLFSLAQAGGIDVDVVFLKPIATEGHSDPTDLAALAQKDVESVFRPVV